METAATSSPDNKINEIKFDDFFETLYQYICFFARISYLSIQRFFDRVDFAKFFETVDENLKDHPVLKFAVFAAAACVAVPIILFIAFAVASLIITFFGFVLFEGFLLGIGGFCVCTLLFLMIMVISMLAILLEISYFAILKLKSF